MAGIYIHVPFCKQKCTYCDFASYPREAGKAAAYFACLLKEADSRAQEFKGMTFDTVYIGGGTPSFVDAKFIGATLNHIRKRFKLIKDPEITIEINPGTLDAEKVKIYDATGINRYSIGLQSADDKRLAELNRIHNSSDFLEACRLLSGRNISADVMIGLKDQKNEEIKRTIDLAVKGGASHISLYALTPEPGTPIYSSYLNGELPSDDETADMYDFAMHYLKSLGFIRYEVSNFARKGFHSRHNLNYWRRGEYVGLGVAASSCVNNRRFKNTDIIDDYIRCILNGRHAEVYSEQIEGDEIKAEYIMLALRTEYGVDLMDYKEKFGSDFTDDYQKEIEDQKDYLDVNKGNVKIKEDFLYVQNQIILPFMR